MKLNIVTKGLEHSESLDEMIKSKLHKIERHFGEDLQVNWVCKIEGHLHWSEVHLIAPHHKDFYTKVEADTMYKTIDIAISKLIGQIEHEHHG